MQDYEKLGVFYLGREYDVSTGKAGDALVLYDSRDLVTHAVVVGMTGSGKTGLCIDIIEEAAIDGVPSILIDPKGDLTNLLLTFPKLDAASFLPWVNADDAARKGLSLEAYAEQQATLWRQGLAQWDESGDRIQRLRDAADFAIYTPGSSAGLPVSILKSLAAPPPEILEDGELLQERINVTVTSLLGLLGIAADPLQSREHILLSTLLGQMWRQGHDFDLAELIAQIQKPPMNKIGVLDLESFYPSKERFSLVMALNNLLASPGFATWLEGAPLDVGQILYTGQGKPRVAIFSIAHLGDAERMFFVSLLLNQVLGWMRTQPGTTSLRALLYMDEIFGYFPPVANPPSKQPLLTLLKQARAYGLGIVLATQNPVDLDYKGLANAGTWFVGRLQTERDKARLIDGLEGAAAASGGSFDRQGTERLLAGIASRVFLMNNSHEDRPVVFQSRWCLSYLRGPLTRAQIKLLMDPYKAAQAPVSEAPAAQATATQAASAQATAAPVLAPAPASGAPVAAAAVPAPATTAAPGVAAAAPQGVQPTLPADVPQFFLPVRGSAKALVYRPMLLGAAKVRFSNAKTGTEAKRDAVFLTPVTDEALPVNWEVAEEAAIAIEDLEKSAEAGQFADLPAAAAKAKNYVAWSRDFVNWLYSTEKLDLLRSPSSGLVSNPGEAERDFRIRLQQAAREKRDAAVQALRQKYAARINALQEKVRRAQQAVEREQDQAKQAKMQTAVSVGATLLGAFLGRKTALRSNVGRATTAVRGASRSLQQDSDVGRAKETLAAYQQQLDELNAAFKAESEALESRVDPMTEALETLTIRPKKSDITVQLVALTWAPYRSDVHGQLSPAW